MRVVVYSQQGGGVFHYRHTIPSRALVRNGHEVVTLDLADDIPTEDALTLACSTSSLLHTGYSIGKIDLGMLAAIRNAHKTRLLTDVDDDIHNVPSYNIAFDSFHKSGSGRKVARMSLRISDAVSVTTPSLLKVYNTDNKHLYHLPNCFDPIDWVDTFVDPKRTADKGIRIMFSGNLGRYGDLLEVKPAIEWAMQKYPHMRLLFMGCTPEWALQWMPSDKHPEFNRAFFITPSSVKYYFKILRWLAPDILINPVVCNEFNRSKSHIKAYDAAMCGAAFLCTDWDTHADVPTTAAVKVRTEYEWRESLGALIEDAALRQRLNTRLHEWAHDCWHIDRHIDKWVNFYEEALARPPRDLDAEYEAKLRQEELSDALDRTNPKRQHDSADEGNASVRSGV